jgi:hypothetical protein
MPFLEHLDEFRRVLMHVVIACVLGRWRAGCSRRA